mmetsp:Transcript_64378/g.182793  ORF Transcript_64378/g.182793 Transcript_64378/m.182793 type:complete len:303 (-) Transcript_64378:257-1165(-)
MAGIAFIFAGLLVAGLPGAATGSTRLLDKGNLRTDLASDEDSRSIVVSADGQEVDQNLIICNAYAHAKGLHIANLRTQQRLTAAGPLAFKECGSFTQPLKEGDRLDFKAGDLSVGIFRTTGLPKSTASLLLIPHRRDRNAMNAAFESHAFERAEGPQVAVVDAYRGKEVGSVKIMDSAEETSDSSKAEAGGAEATPRPRRRRVEDLKFNSVVTLRPGKYDVLLEGKDEAGSLSSARLLVSQGTYVIMRTGNQPEPANRTVAGQQASFSQELVVFPQSSGAALAHVHCFTLVAAALAGLAFAL